VIIGVFDCQYGGSLFLVSQCDKLYGKEHVAVFDAVFGSNTVWSK